MKQKTKLEDKVSVVKQDWEESERYWGVNGTDIRCTKQWKTAVIS